MLYFLPPPYPKLVSAPLRGLLQTNSAFFKKKKWNIARSIMYMYFIMNVYVIIARQNFSAHPVYLSFSKFNNRQNMF